MTLIDANVLIAAFLPGHTHHEQATRDLHTLRDRSEQVLLHPLVLAAFFRLTTTKHLGVPAAKPAECIAFVRSLYQHLSTTPFSERPDQLEAFETLFAGKRRSTRHINDLWLAACARTHNATILTYDKGLAALASQH